MVLQTEATKEVMLRTEGTTVPAHVKDLGLVERGLNRIEWAEAEMPVLRQVRERFEREQPLKGLRLSACLHVTAETANLMRTLQAGGADLSLCGSNPLSTQDDVAAALVEHSASRPTPSRARIPIRITAISWRPWTTAAHHDGRRGGPGLSMLFIALDRLEDVHPKVRRLGRGAVGRGDAFVPERRARQQRRDDHGRDPPEGDGEGRGAALPGYRCERVRHQAMFDNRYGTGQSTIDGIIRATNILLAGKTYSDLRLRLVRARRRHAGQGPGRSRHRD